MPNQIFLPDCLTHAYHKMFPNLDFSRVSFFDGIPFPFNTGQDAITLTSGRHDINIYLQDGTYNPCNQNTFKFLAHELVHAMQIEKELPDLPFSNIWIARYVACTITGFSSNDRGGNALENEAYAYEAVVLKSNIQPCKCGDTVPWLVLNPDFDNEFAQHPELIKADVSDDVCFIPGPLKGTIIQVLWGLIALAIGILVNTLYSIVDSIVTIAQDIGNFFTNLFAHDQKGHLNLLFSTDNGNSFGNKVTFESSSQQPALALTQNNIIIGWTGTDQRPNILVEPGNMKTTIKHEKSNDCGLALALDGSKLYMAWQGTNNRLNVMSSPDGQHFGNKVTLREKSPDNATPGLVFGSGFLYLSWIGTNNKLNIIASSDGINWRPETKITLREKSGNDGTAALGFANGKLYLAWTGRDNRHRLNVISFLLLGGGRLQAQSKITLIDRSTDSAGPALSSVQSSQIPPPTLTETSNSGAVNESSVSDLLFLGWTGNDNNNRLNIMSSADGQKFGNKRTFEKSNDHTGPGLASTSGLLCIAWIGKA